MNLPDIRIGNGYDVHRLVEGRKLILGGVDVPHSMGLDGHSDADVLVHALCDALLGALGAGDIGKYFPDTDPKYQNSNSLDLLREAHSMLRDAGYTIVNIDTNIVLQQPKLNPHIDAIRASLAKTLELNIDRISVKAKTNEGVGPVGREEAVSTQAIVLIQSNA